MYPSSRKTCISCLESHSHSFLLSFLLLKAFLDLIDNFIYSSCIIIFKTVTFLIDWQKILREDEPRDLALVAVGV